VKMTTIGTEWVVSAFSCVPRTHVIDSLRIEQTYGFHDKWDRPLLKFSGRQLVMPISRHFQPCKNSTPSQRHIVE
jgi:hypothetical protein